MKFGHTLVYVPGVPASLAFFEGAFGFTRRFLYESGDYGELETGETTLAFAALSLGESHFPAGFVAAHESLKPRGMELAFVTASVASAHAKALAAGATKSTRRLQNRGGKSCRTCAARMGRWWSYVRLWRLRSTGAHARRAHRSRVNCSV
jgi:lactoylglutathione lyase